MAPEHGCGIAAIESSQDEVTVWSMDARGNDVCKKVKRKNLISSVVWLVDDQGRDVRKTVWLENGLEGKT